MYFELETVWCQYRLRCDGAFQSEFLMGFHLNSAGSLFLFRNWGSTPTGFFKAVCLSFFGHWMKITGWRKGEGGAMLKTCAMFRLKNSRRSFLEEAKRLNDIWGIKISFKQAVWGVSSMHYLLASYPLKGQNTPFDFSKNRWKAAQSF